MDLYSYRNGGGPPPPQQNEKNEALLAHYSVKYVRQSKSVAILWGVFTFCSAILNIVVFLSEEWVGATDKAKSPGHFGLWKFCMVLKSSAFAVEGSIPEPDVVCFGSLENFSSIISPAFRASTVFVGLAVLMSILCLVAMLLFCFMKDQSVYEICATIQALQGLCLVVGILCFPAGWDNLHVQGICGKEANDYALGLCGIRWAFVMAFICIIDSFILCILAIVLSNRNVEPLPPSTIPPHLRGEYNGGYISDSQSLAGSRKSLAMPNQVMMIPQFQVPQPPPTPGGTLPPPEQYSDGQTPAGIPPPYGSYSQMQNFQL